MPIVLDQQIEKARLVVWKITETTDALFLSARLTEPEKEQYAAFCAESRKKEWLAARALVRQVLGAGVVIRYNAVGAPELEPNDCFISVSHTGDTVAVLFAEKRCGIDLESRSRRFLRVERKIIGESERVAMGQSPHDENTTCGVIWCAKEALFKFYGEVEVDFIRDIRVISITDRSLVASFRGKTTTLFYFVSEHHILAVAL